MMPSSLIHHRTETRHSDRLPTGGAPHLRRHPRLARNSINRVAQHAVHSFTPARPPNI
jgi:hypothetical protein